MIRAMMMMNLQRTDELKWRERKLFFSILCCIRLTYFMFMVYIIRIFYHYFFTDFIPNLFLFFSIEHKMIHFCIIITQYKVHSAQGLSNCKNEIKLKEINTFIHHECIKLIVVTLKSFATLLTVMSWMPRSLRRCRLRRRGMLLGWNVVHSPSKTPDRG